MSLENELAYEREVRELRGENARLTEKLARCVEALEQIAGASKGNLRHPAKIARTALAAAKGGA